MCTGLEPTMLAGLAASTAGAGLNASMENQAINAQNAENQRTMEMQRAASEGEAARQLEMEALQAQEVANALMGVDPAQTSRSVAQAVAAPSNEITSLPAQHNTRHAPSVQNKDVQEASAPGNAEVASRLAQVLGGASALNEQTKAFGGMADILNRSRSNVANIGSNRSGSSRVAGLETGIPTAQVSKSSSPIGDILLAGGNLAAGVGGKSIGAAGGQLFPQIGDLFAPKKTAQPFLQGLY